MEPEKEEEKCAHGDGKHGGIEEEEQRHKKQAHPGIVCRQNKGRNNMIPTQKDKEGGGPWKRREKGKKDT